MQPQAVDENGFVVGTYDVFGCTIGFAAPRPHLDIILDGLSFARPRWTDADPDVWYNAVHTEAGLRYERRDPGLPPDPARIGRTPARVLDDLHLSVALHAREGVFVHAGAVVWNGRAIVLPGRSRWGKSTLVEALVRAGAAYLSDEYARLLPDGSIGGYTRPIHLRTPNGRSLVDPTSIGTLAEGTYRPAAVVLTRYAIGPEWDPERLSPASATLAILDNTVAAAAEPERAMRAAAALARQTDVLFSCRGEASAAVQPIFDIADRAMAESRHDA